MLSRIKWGNPVCATGPARARIALEWSPLSALRGGEFGTIECSVPLCLVMQACSLHWNGCFHVGSLGWRSCIVICHSVVVDCNGMAASRFLAAAAACVTLLPFAAASRKS